MGATINNKSTTTEPTAVEASLDILTVYRGVRDSFLSFEFRGSASVYIIPASTSTKLYSCVLCLSVIIFLHRKTLRLFRIHTGSPRQKATIHHTESKQTSHFHVIAELNMQVPLYDLSRPIHGLRIRQLNFQSR